MARDALGFNLNYFHGDYSTINPGVNPFPSYRTPSNGLPDTEYRPLYNGNISSMVSYIRKFEAVNHNVPIFYNYRYDQLNRYVRQDSYFGFNKATNTYGAWTPDSTFRERVAYDANGNIQTFVRHAINQGGALMDNLTYKYYTGTNQLRQVNDVVADNSYGTNPSNPVVDIDNQTDTSNYVYDAIGNLIQDKAEKITNIQWNVYGKITEITRNALTTDRVTTTRTRYTYDAQGNRISKAVKSYKTSGNRYEIDFTWYVRDAQGNLLSTYITTSIDTSAGADLASLTLKQTDVQLYGSSRLGNLPTINSVVDNGGNTGPWINPDYRGSTYYRGYRQYELTNHLGNVLTTISDRKIPVYSNGSLNLPGGFTVPIADYFEPDMVSATDYYPFGMVSRGIGPSDKYRFGFNGKENDNEVKGFAQQQDYGMRIYDPRVGRFLSVDPLAARFPEYSPFQYAGNSPIANIDLDGAEEFYYNAIKKDGKTKLQLTKVVNKKSFLGFSWVPSHKAIVYDAVNDDTYRFLLDGSVPNEAWNDIPTWEHVVVTGDLEAATSISEHRSHSFSRAIATAAMSASDMRVRIEINKKIVARQTNPKASIEPSTSETENTATVYRTQGGELPNASQHRITIGKDGRVKIEGDQMLYVTINDKQHQVYFYEKRGGNDKGAYIASFKIPQSLADEIKNNAVPQAQGKAFPDKPQISDPTKSSGAYGLPKEYIKKIQEQAIPGSGQIQTPKE